MKFWLIISVVVFALFSGWFILNMQTQIPESNQISEKNARDLFVENHNKIESDINAISNRNIKINFSIPEKLKFTEWWSWNYNLYSNSSCFFLVALNTSKNIEIYYFEACSKDSFNCQYFSCKKLHIIN